MRFRYLFFILILLLSINFVLGLGVTPGRTTVNYESGLLREVIFSVLNNEDKEMQVLLMVRGELNDSITLYDGLVSFSPGQKSKQFKYKINLDRELAPGLHKAEIVAIEIPKSTSNGMYVGTTLAVVSQLYVYVPYPGKYIDADLNVLDAEENKTATFVVPVVNRGKLAIGEARAVIDVYNSLNDKVGSFETDYWPLESGARTELSVRWNVDFPSGDYLAKVSVFYDGETKNFDKEFRVGDLTLNIESIFANNFQLGEIAKLEILIENKMDKKLNSVFANLLVYDEDNGIMADVRSVSESVDKLSREQLIIYWDTGGVKVGEYNGKLMVKYDKKSTDKNLVLRISDDKLDIFGVGYAIQAKGGNGFDITDILIILIVILILINISWFVFFRRLLIKRRKV